MLPSLTLHSTVVLLKAIPPVTVTFAPTFTFYCSSIKGITGPSIRLAEASLHSTVVLLKAKYHSCKIDIQTISLHSTVVLLKAS